MHSLSHRVRCPPQPAGLSPEIGGPPLHSSGQLSPPAGQAVVISLAWLAPEGAHLPEQTACSTRFKRVLRAVKGRDWDGPSVKAGEGSRSWCARRGRVLEGSWGKGVRGHPLQPREDHVTTGWGVAPRWSRAHQLPAPVPTSVKWAPQGLKRGSSTLHSTENPLREGPG